MSVGQTLLCSTPHLQIMTFARQQRAVKVSGHPVLVPGVEKALCAVAYANTEVTRSHSLYKDLEYDVRICSEM